MFPSVLYVIFVRLYDPPFPLEKSMIKCSKRGYDGGGRGKGSFQKCSA
jgi:hypothetical protein